METYVSAGVYDDAFGDPGTVAYMLPPAKYFHEYEYEVGDPLQVPFVTENVVVPATPLDGLIDGAAVFTGGDTAVHTAINVIGSVGVKDSPTAKVYSKSPAEGYRQFEKTKPCLVPGLGAV